MRPLHKAGTVWMILVCGVAVAMPAAASVSSAPAGARSAGVAQQEFGAPVSVAGTAQRGGSLPPGSRVVDTVVSNT
ncbi:MAG TPA: hypothetical protein VIK54_08760, partial [Acidimicrobiia bacterium]